MDKSSLLADLGKIIAEFEEVDIAYVFGSFLESDEFNDIDIALLLSEKPGLDPYQSLKFSLKVAGELERQIKPRFEFEVKVLNISPPEFQFKVIRKGYLFQVDGALQNDFATLKSFLREVKRLLDQDLSSL